MTPVDSTLLRIGKAERQTTEDATFYHYKEGLTFFYGGRRDLFVRQAYRDLYERMGRSINEGRRRFLILGNPGIGKTYFNYFLLEKLKRKGVRDIVLCMRVADTPVFHWFSSDKVALFVL